MGETPTEVERELARTAPFANTDATGTYTGDVDADEVDGC